ncbi:MAG: hypothetical protein KGZ65_04390 [Sphingomonadales bacterium]|nr:hypothetical protein [Sphingomonadaceae bacterium]MBS3930453.1 hypothetical protein [Sphingomonadales bacterium]
MDQLAENDKVFNNLLTAAADMPNFLQFDNTFGVKGEIAAGSTYKKLILLDASNVVQLGESGTEVRVPADPSNALGVATKQYVDGVQMFQSQAIVTVNSGLTGSFATILSLSATTRGVVHAIWIDTAGGSSTCRIKVTVDGTLIIDDTSGALTNNRFYAMRANGNIETTASTDAGDAGHPLEIRFTSTLLIEATSGDGNSRAISVRYSKIP